MSFTTGMILGKQCHIEVPQTILQENVYRTTCINKHVVVSFPLVVSSVIGMAKTSTQPSDPPHSIPPCLLKTHHYYCTHIGVGSCGIGL